MMKAALLIICFACITPDGHGQEKFKPLIERIALLELYLGYLKTGYDVAKEGLNTVRDFKNGEFELHKNYFDGLSLVNFKIKNYVKVSEVMALYSRLVKDCNRAQKEFIECKELTPDEVNWLREVFNKFIQDCNSTLDALLGIVTDGELQLTDDQRLLRIETLHKDMTRKSTFLQYFNAEARNLILYRIKDENDIHKTREQYQLK